MSSLAETTGNHRYAASIRRLRREGRSRADDHMIDWCARHLSAEFLHGHDLMLPNVVKVVSGSLKEHTTNINDTDDKTYVLHAKYTHEVFVTVPAGDTELYPKQTKEKFLLPLDYHGRFHVLYDTRRVCSVTDLARILPKCAKVKSILKNISTKANTFQLNIGTVINVEGVTYSATKLGVQAFLRCSFRGKTFFTLNMDCIGDFEILPDEQTYSLREIERRYPTPVRVRITEDPTNHDELFSKSNTGEFILETINKEDFLAGNCKADNSMILFSSRSEVKFKVTNAVIQRERDNRFIVRHYGKEYFPVKFNFANIIGLNGASFVETTGNEKYTSLLNML